VVDEPRRRIPISADWVLKRIQEGKKVRLKNAVIEGDLDPYKLDLPTEHVERTEAQKLMGLKEDVKIVHPPIHMSDSTIKGSLHFSNLTFSSDAWFEGVTFSSDAMFVGATFSRGARFEGATFSVDADFNGTKFKGYASFSRATFNGYADFRGATFSRHVGFRVATFGSFAYFDEATFSGVASFSRAIFDKFARFIGATFCVDVSFGGATFSGVADFRGGTFRMGADFSGAKFEGDLLTFRDATFTLPESQEQACRKAKNVLAKAGNRDEEEYHFYREMEAKRKQKLTKYEDFDYEALLFDENLHKENFDLKRWGFTYHILNLLEYIFIQKIFGYGIHPFWLFGWWLGFVVTFAIIYWMGGGVGIPEINGEINQSSNLIDYLWFSIATAATPGYALYKPLGNFKLVAGIQAILGTFMWAAFITTFARKFSR
jgi:uncharacterized protein YjbI with pentapeptide repeats